MRGKVTHQLTQPCAYGITPAHARKRNSTALKSLTRWDHPRACGEKGCISRIMSRKQGSPPRMRGKVGDNLSPMERSGITPAHAGKSFTSDGSQQGSKDHPRACGEKFNRIAKPFREQGSPPRMRGKVDAYTVQVVDGGITPAHAGKRPLSLRRSTAWWDHPRACGEKSAGAAERLPRLGSPPRMRGKVHVHPKRPEQSGITPAHAGKSQSLCGRTFHGQDHPRACGEKVRPFFITS